MKRLVSLLGVGANMMLTAGKISIGMFANSTAILADGINSATDVIASIVNYIGVRIADKPADQSHPYGHGKAEVISGFVITLFILGSGLWICYDAIRGFFDATIPQIGLLSYGIMAVSAAANLIMSRLKIHIGRKHDSLSLVSDGIHSQIDFLVSIAIFVGLFLIPLWSHIDSLLALAVGMYIIKEAISLGRETTDILMGAHAGDETEEQIRDIIKDAGVELKELKTQKLGSKIFADIAITLPAHLKVDEAQNIREGIETQLSSTIQGLEYTAIQIESHDIQTAYYRSAMGKGFGWKRHSGAKEAKGAGPGGVCICPECGHEMPHIRGQPCAKMTCPKCGTSMQRKQ